MVKQVEWRNRIIESGSEAPDQLLANPFNARIHPKLQQDALSSVLDNIGWIAPVIVNKRTGHVIDGHLRVSLALTRQERSIPVDYVDLDENEEKTLLATFDYITGMAVYDREAVDTLLSEINSDDNGVQALLESLGVKHGNIPPDNPYEEWQGMPDYEQSDLNAKYSIVIHIETEEDLQKFSEAINQPVTVKTKTLQFPVKRHIPQFNNKAVDDEP